MRTQRTRRLFLAVTALTALATALCAGGAGASTAAKQAGSPDWVDYFYPLKVGWTCQQSIDTVSVRGTETLTVAAISSVPGGRAVTIDESGATTVDGTSVPSNAALHYVLTGTGNLIEDHSGGQLLGQSAQIVGNTTFASVRSLLSGASSVSHLHIVTPLAQSSLAQLKPILAPGASRMDMSVALRQSGSTLAVLHTQMGTYHRVLVVHTALQSLEVTDIVRAARKDVDSELRQNVGKEYDVTTWYAPHVGPVKVNDAGITSYTTSCGPS
jgi:hypothetical protein